MPHQPNLKFRNRRATQDGRPLLRKKGGRMTNRRPKRHVYVLPSDAVKKIRPFVERAKKGGYVFVEDTGGHVDRESMHPGIRAASRRAGIVKKKTDNCRKKGRTSTIGAIASLAQIRAEVITVVTEEISLKEAAAHNGHIDETTTDRWYVKDRVTRKELAEKFRPAEIIAKAIPLREGTVN